MEAGSVPFVQYFISNSHKRSHSKIKVQWRIVEFFRVCNNLLSQVIRDDMIYFDMNKLAIKTIKM